MLKQASIGIQGLAVVILSLSKELVTGFLGITQQHVGVLFEENWVVKSGKGSFILFEVGFTALVATIT